MQSAGMSLPQGVDAQKFDVIYGYALDGVPSCGLTIATQKLIRGDYAGNPDILLGMIPKPPILAALAKQEARAAREDLARKRETASALKGVAPEVDRSPEVMARVQARLNQFRQEHEEAKAKERGVVVHEPMSPEKAEYWAKISELPDWWQVGAEQMAFRRKIEGEMAEVQPEEQSNAA
ncbi:hypothetical protein C6558_36275 [Ensifer sp. NM-2]|nr:hypothetical protein C6558_36275 [Ensifer sp. NM-2]